MVFTLHKAIFQSTNASTWTQIWTYHSHEQGKGAQRKRSSVGVYRLQLSRKSVSASCRTQRRGPRRGESQAAAARHARGPGAGGGSAGRLAGAVLSGVLPVGGAEPLPAPGLLIVPSSALYLGPRAVSKHGRRGMVLAALFKPATSVPLASDDQLLTTDVSLLPRLGSSVVNAVVIWRAQTLVALVIPLLTQRSAAFDAVSADLARLLQLHGRLTVLETEDTASLHPATAAGGAPESRSRSWAGSPRSSLLCASGICARLTRPRL